MWYQKEIGRRFGREEELLVSGEFIFNFLWATVGPCGLGSGLTQPRLRQRSAPGHAYKPAGAKTLGKTQKSIL